MIESHLSNELASLHLEQPVMPPQIRANEPDNSSNLYSMGSGSLVFIEK